MTRDSGSDPSGEDAKRLSGEAIAERPTQSASPNPSRKTNPMPNNIEQRAREMLAAEYEADGVILRVQAMRADSLGPDDKRAIRAITKALSTHTGIEEAESYAAWQQKRGMLPDVIDWAINEYDEFMLDDAYDSQRVLDRIAARLKEVRSLLPQEGETRG